MDFLELNFPIAWSLLSATSAVHNYTLNTVHEYFIIDGTVLGLLAELNFIERFST